MSSHHGTLPSAGSMHLRMIRTSSAVSRWPDGRLTLRSFIHDALPRRGLTPEVNAWRRQNLGRNVVGVRRILLAQLLRLPTIYGRLYITVIRRDGAVIDFGLASTRIVTTVGVRFICDDFNNGGTDVSTMKFHGYGTGGGAEAVGNTALTTEVTNTTYVGDVRPTGSQASATVGSDATYTTVATYAPDSGTPIAVTEHGLFSANAGGTLFDRSLFAVQNLAASDSLQSTYVLTAVAGG